MYCNPHGIFVGLLSYPFQVNGRDLYERFVVPFFIQHQEYLHSHYPTEVNEKEQIQELYQPKGYRMFGKQGLAVLALHDDMAFAFRIFNSSHIDIDNLDEKMSIDDIYRFKSVIISGTSESRSQKPYLLRKAKNTFLRRRKRYPYIGIIRLKIDYQLLNGNGIQLIRNIKKNIQSVFVNQLGMTNEEVSDYIIFDGNDSDEMAVIGFSNSLVFLYHFFTNIEHLSVFSACHTNYGYDIQYDTAQSILKGFLPSVGDSEIQFSCWFEAKPGHEKELDTLCMKKFACVRLFCNGNYLATQLKLEDLIELTRKTSDNPFLQHLLRAKFKLIENFTNTISQNIELGKRKNSVVLERISFTQKNIIKIHLAHLGVSKITRERLLALIDFYNDCVETPLQGNFFSSLLSSVVTLDKLIIDFIDSDIALPQIEKIVNGEISALEGAMYNRLNNHLCPNTTLEYGGGIQQYLHSLGYAYQEIGKILSVELAKSQYLFITGSELVSSTRTHFEMNINHVIYPQLFCTIAWKEAANYSSLLSIKPKYTNLTNEDSDILKFWNQVKSFQRYQLDSESRKKLTDILANEVSFLGNTELLEDVISAIKVIDSYIINDFIVYHFAFQRDFSLMWHHYWAIFLQTASNYNRERKIQQKKFVLFMLRLMLVGLEDTESENGPSLQDYFLEEQSTRPFEYTMAQVWLTSYVRLKETAASLKKIYDFYGLNIVLEGLISLYELRTAGTSMQESDISIRTLALKSRESRIERLTKYFMNGQIIDRHSFGTRCSAPERIVSLMNAYLRVIKDLSPANSIKSIPLNTTFCDEGKVNEHNTLLLNDYYTQCSPILSDPKGGFFCMSPEVRKKYFLYNTIFYKALWDLSYQF